MLELFPVDKVNQMRRKFETARAMAGSTLHDDGWHKSDLSPDTLLNTLDCLWLKEGFTLRAYLYRSGENGNGIVWAMPIDSLFPEPSECERLTDQFLDPPKPEHALDDFMEAIDGDHTAWSYMCASILSRELLEFGAKWHGCECSDERIVSFKSGENKSYGMYPHATHERENIICSFITASEHSGSISLLRFRYNKCSYNHRVLKRIWATIGSRCVY